jgi:hypothetical protein
VGVEISGQQQGFIQWIMNEMNYRDIFFNLTNQKGNPGIRPATDKLARFNMVVPLFKQGKIRFPLELKSSKIVGLFLEQISLATKDGIKGKDDCIDTISMLQYMNPWVPAVDVHEETAAGRSGEVWGKNDLDPHDIDDGSYSSYVV